MEFIKKYKALLLMGVCVLVVLICCLYIMMGDDGEDGDMGSGGSLIAEYYVSASGDGSIVARLYKDGLLDISGKGDMKDMSDEIPWLDHCRKIKNVKISEGVTSVGSYAFYHCTLLVSVELPNGITSVGAHAFDGSTLGAVKLPVTLNEIGEFAFDGCPLIELTIPAGVKKMGYRAFQNCTSLTVLNIENGVAEIGDRAFYGCTELKSVIIPTSVTMIGNGAFFGCSKLTKVGFERIEGWYLTDNKGATAGTMVSVLTDTENALALTQTKADFYWKRNA